MKKLVTVFLVLITASAAAAQSGRKPSDGGSSAEVSGFSSLSVKDMYTQAVNYARDKFTELEEKNAPYSEALHRQILKEQEQFSAKYAAEAASRPDLADTDFYYLGRLHWLATNSDDAWAAFEKFLASASDDHAEMKQTARSVVVVMSAERGRFERAEKALADYIANKPQRLSELLKMEKEIAYRYKLEGRFGDASPHASKAFEAATSLLYEEQSRARALSQLLDSGVTAFEIERELNNSARAESILASMKKYGADVNSHSVYFRAVDEQIKYMIESGRKTSAMAYYANAMVTVQKDFPDVSVRAAVERNLKRREPHYKILGSTAPELQDIEHWIPSSPAPLAGFRGKVVLLDFWATWCGPCFEAFPDLIKWHEELGEKGLVILGVTRYYGQADGEQASKTEEIAFLKRFKEKEGLPYGFAVADGQTNQIKYGAMSIPTTVIIDRKGVVRYVETGAGSNRKQEIRDMVDRLLAELP